MEKDTLSPAEETKPEEQPEPATDWASLRAQADKLGISLSEFQQKEREKKARLARKNRPHAAPLQSSPNQDPSAT
jgi:hypothetical protein